MSADDVVKAYRHEKIVIADRKKRRDFWIACGVWLTVFAVMAWRIGQC